MRSDLQNDQIQYGGALEKTGDLIRGIRKVKSSLKVLLYEEEVAAISARPTRPCRGCFDIPRL